MIFAMLEAISSIVMRWASIPEMLISMARLSPMLYYLLPWVAIVRKLLILDESSFT